MSTVNPDPVAARRCPVCLNQQIPSAETTAGHHIRCSRCGYSSPWSTWLKTGSLRTNADDPRPSFATSLTSDPFADVAPASAWRSPLGLTLLGLTGLAWYVSAHVMVGMRGPAFLVFYLLVLVSAWGISYLFGRIVGHPRIFSFMGFLLYEGVGVIRFVTGLQAGMSKFGFLVLMMLAGVALFGLRIKDGDLYLFGVYLEPSKGGGDSSGCSGTSGCGGSGCGGGGGCGGCGGS